jgi:hypothetical protein
MLLYTVYTSMYCEQMNLSNVISSSSRYCTILHRTVCSCYCMHRAAIYTALYCASMYCIVAKCMSTYQVLYETIQDTDYITVKYSNESAQGTDYIDVISSSSSYVTVCSHDCMYTVPYIHINVLCSN